MNIFKILANGYGSINENNVSAFLGYLLDPNENHGLGYEFLKLFLKEFEIEDFNPEHYDFQVFYEQTFKKQRIDICLVCYESENKGNSQFLMSNFMESTKTIEKVFLIENKISSG